MTETQIVTLIVKSRGRKWFSCVKGAHKAQLLINEVTTGLEVDRIVKVRVVDLSTSSAYGRQLRFEAVEVLEDRDAAQARADAAARRETEKWLGYAESDAAHGSWRTNAIGRVLAEADRDDEFTGRRQVFFTDPPAPAGTPFRFGGRPVVLLRVVRRVWLDAESGAGAVYDHHGQWTPADGWATLYELRDADAEETAQLVAAETAAAAQAARRRARSDRRRRLEQLITGTGQCPAPGGRGIDLAGARLLGGPDLYGGGDWFVITEDAVWYVRNNGMDGDDWSLNNVTTGGAGAIGWRVPRNPDIETELTELAQEQEQEQEL